jgi:hemoglobin
MKSDIIGPDDIRNLIDEFYERAGSDTLLGPIFSRLKDPGADKKRLYTYWRTALLNDMSDAHEPFPKHIEEMLSSRHFIRWLTLFLQTIDDLYAGQNAQKVKAIVIKKSEEFQTSLELFRF